MSDEKLNKILNARCEECGSKSVIITGSNKMGTAKGVVAAETEIYYYQCSDCGNVFYIIKD